MADYTATQLISRVRLWAATASGTPPSLTDDQIIELLNEELRSVITPKVLAMNQEYLVDYEDKTLDATTTTFSLPSRAIMGKLREVKIYDAGANTYRNMPLMNLESSDDFRNRLGIYFTGNTLNAVNPGLAGGGKSLRLYYYVRPSDIVSVASCALITTPGTINVTVASVPPAWSSSVTVDVVQGRPPFGILAKSQSATISGKVITLAVPSLAQVGDWVSLEMEAPLATVPLEFHNILCQGVVIKVLEILGDAQGLQIATARHQQMMKALDSFGPNRITGEPRMCVPRNTFV